MITVSKWHITIYGDRSVGIFDAHFTLDGKFYFEDAAEIEAFREKITELFSLYEEARSEVLADVEADARCASEEEREGTANGETNDNP